MTITPAVLSVITIVWTSGGTHTMKLPVLGSARAAHAQCVKGTPNIMRLLVKFDHSHGNKMRTIRWRCRRVV